MTVKCLLDIDGVILGNNQLTSRNQFNKRNKDGKYIKVSPVNDNGYTVNMYFDKEHVLNTIQTIKDHIDNIYWFSSWGIEAHKLTDVLGLEAFPVPDEVKLFCDTYEWKLIGAKRFIENNPNDKIIWIDDFQYGIDLQRDYVKSVYDEPNIHFLKINEDEGFSEKDLIILKEWIK